MIHITVFYCQGRSESRLTVASDCSSTISTEDEEPHHLLAEPAAAAAGPGSHLTEPSVADHKNNRSSSSQSSVIPVPPPPPPPKALAGNSLAADTTKGGGGSTTNLSPATKNRLASLFKKIPKLTKSRSREDDDTAASYAAASPAVAAVKRSPSSGSMRTLPPTPTLARKNPSSSSGVAVERTRSMSSDNGFNRTASDRGSYRAPRGTSRYMQAAEAYKYRTVNAAGSGGGLAAAAASANGSNGAINSGGGNTWSSSSRRPRARPSLNSDTFTPRPARTASASPAVTRKRLGSTGGGGDTSGHTPANSITSTHSTPVRRPPGHKSATSSGGSRPEFARSHSRDFGNGGGLRRSQSRDQAGAADIETDEMILKRMEEILLTYKTKVEDRLAAEGKELPKDIFQDFTEHWLHASEPYRAKSMDSLNSSEKSSSERTPPPPCQARSRKDTKEGYSSTKIPRPVFYKNSLS